MDKNSWETFENTGKINDYLAFKASEKMIISDGMKPAEAINNADKNAGNGVETTQYR